VSGKAELVDRFVLACLLFKSVSYQSPRTFIASKPNHPCLTNLGKRSRQSSSTSVPLVHVAAVQHLCRLSLITGNTLSKQPTLMHCMPLAPFLAPPAHRPPIQQLLAMPYAKNNHAQHDQPKIPPLMILWRWTWRRQADWTPVNPLPPKCLLSTYTGGKGEFTQWVHWEFFVSPETICPVVTQQVCGGFF
jgi:hypothetical protein